MFGPVDSLEGEALGLFNGVQRLPSVYTGCGRSQHARATGESQKPNPPRATRGKVLPLECGLFTPVTSLGWAGFGFRVTVSNGLAVCYTF